MDGYLQLVSIFMLFIENGGTNCQFVGLVFSSKYLIEASPISIFIFLNMVKKRSFEVFTYSLFCGLQKKETRFFKVSIIHLSIL